jgi:hypothetical protein
MSLGLAVGHGVMSLGLAVGHGGRKRRAKALLSSPNRVRRGGLVGEIEMAAEVKRKPHRDDGARDKRERAHQENALDEALKDTFPASDPVSAEQPVSPSADRGRAKT